MSTQYFHPWGQYPAYWNTQFSIRLPTLKWSQWTPTERTHSKPFNKDQPTQNNHRLLWPPMDSLKRLETPPSWLILEDLRFSEPLKESSEGEVRSSVLLLHHKRSPSVIQNAFRVFPYPFYSASLVFLKWFLKSSLTAKDFNPNYFRESFLPSLNSFYIFIYACITNQTEEEVVWHLELYNLMQRRMSSRSHHSAR